MMHFDRIGVLAASVFLAGSTSTTMAQVVYDSTQILPSTPAIGEDFGSSVALGPNYMIVGSEFSSDLFSLSGAVSVYSRSTGAFVRKLVPAGLLPSDLLGSSVAIQGDTVVAGARVGGEAYLFNAASGSLLRTLRPSDGSSSSNFGISVAIHGDLVLVGAVSSPNPDGSTGGVYAYSLSTPTDFEIVRLAPDLFMGDDRFGDSIAMNDEYIVISAVNDSSNDAVYVFDVVTGARLHRLEPDPSAVDPSFGRSVAIIGNLIVVGASTDNTEGNQAGAVYLFDASTGAQLLKIAPPQLTSSDFFGSSVAVSGSVLFVGAPGDQLTGSVYAFVGSELEPFDILRPPEVNGFDFFGTSMSSDGSEVLVGAPESAPELGAAYLLFPRCAADLNNDGSVDFFDVSTFIGEMIDFNEDGIFNFFDVSAFLNAYNTSCP